MVATFQINGIETQVCRAVAFSGSSLYIISSAVAESDSTHSHGSLKKKITLISITIVLGLDLPLLAIVYTSVCFVNVVVGMIFETVKVVPCRSSHNVPSWHRAAI